VGWRLEGCNRGLSFDPWGVDRHHVNLLTLLYLGTRHMIYFKNNRSKINILMTFADQFPELEGIITLLEKLDELVKV